MPVVNYWEIKDEIAQLKRDQQYDQALVLLTKAIETLETEVVPTGNRVSPWPFEHSAIIYRKTKRYDDEIEVVRRYFRAANQLEKRAVKLAKRLPKAYKLANRPQSELDTDDLLLRHVLLIDIETSGFSNQDELIELGAILFSVHLASGQTHVIDTYSGLRQPSFSIPYSATKVHGITDIMVQGHKLDDKRVMALIDKADFFLAHNASYDRRFLRQLYPEIANKTWYCSMNGIDWKAKGNPTKKLQDLLATYDVTKEAQQHRGLDDAMATFSLLRLVESPGKPPFMLEMLMGNPMGTSNARGSRPIASKVLKDNQKRDGNFFTRLDRRKQVIFIVVAIVLLCFCCLLAIGAAGSI